MVDYEHLYYGMVQASEKAITAIEAQNYGTARELLIAAEQDAEEEYLRQTDTPEDNRALENSDD